MSFMVLRDCALCMVCSLQCASTQSLQPLRLGCRSQGSRARGATLGRTLRFGWLRALAPCADQLQLQLLAWAAWPSAEGQAGQERGAWCGARPTDSFGGVVCFLPTITTPVAGTVLFTCGTSVSPQLSASSLPCLHGILSCPAITTNCSSQESSNRTNDPVGPAPRPLQQCWPTFLVRLPAELVIFTSQISLSWIHELNNEILPTIRDKT